MFDSVVTTSGGGVDRLDPAALAALPKSERLALLRQRMAGVTSRVDRAAPPLPSPWPPRTSSRYPARSVTCCRTQAW